MSKHLVQALKEWNSNQPAWKPVLPFEKLTPAAQSEVEQRAEELEIDEVLTSLDSVVG